MPAEPAAAIPPRLSAPTALRCGARAEVLHEHRDAGACGLTGPREPVRRAVARATAPRWPPGEGQR